MPDSAKRTSVIEDFDKTFCRLTGDGTGKPMQLVPRYVANFRASRGKMCNEDTPLLVLRRQCRSGGAAILSAGPITTKKINAQTLAMPQSNGLSLNRQGLATSIAENMHQSTGIVSERWLICEAGVKARRG